MMRKQELNSLRSPSSLDFDVDVGSKVFAKLKGFPSWPARVEYIHVNKTDSAQNKYVVRFFGTHQVATVKALNLAEFSKMVSITKTFSIRKGLREALKEAEKEPDFPPETEKKPKEKAVEKKSTRRVDALENLIGRDDEIREILRRIELTSGEISEDSCEEFSDKDECEDSSSEEESNEVLLMELVRTCAERYKLPDALEKLKEQLDAKVNKIHNVWSQEQLEELIRKEQSKIPAKEKKRVSIGNEKEKKKEKRTLKSGKVVKKRAAKESKLVVTKAKLNQVNREEGQSQLVECNVPIIKTEPAFESEEVENSLPQIEDPDDPTQKVYFTKYYSNKDISRMKKILKIADNPYFSYILKLIAKYSPEYLKKKYEKTEEAFIQMSWQIAQLMQLSNEEHKTKEVIELLKKMIQLDIYKIMLYKNTREMMIIFMLTKYVGHPKRHLLPEKQLAEIETDAEDIRNLASLIFDKFKRAILDLPPGTSCLIKGLASEMNHRIYEIIREKQNIVEELVKINNDQILQLHQETHAIYMTETEYYRWLDLKSEQLAKHGIDGSK
ncbi:PC4 and SFRS1-interacting protein-like [Neocloeon triangulifer]|uniref:PC4 and SFRS1-interacting protein-like n=1 Tax=Neocloeon triangulifer TaxID=2078957 RepID=UPI00286EBDB7|nr:PC4 and SFRS1-interacting protein-like [Neocloeon triangulifer]